MCLLFSLPYQHFTLECFIVMEIHNNMLLKECKLEAFSWHSRPWAGKDLTIQCQTCCDILRHKGEGGSKLLSLCLIPRTRGPWSTSLNWEAVLINKHFCIKQWLCHYIRRKKWLPHFWVLNGWLFIKLKLPSNKDTLPQVWLKLVLWFIMVFSL